MLNARPMAVPRHNSTIRRGGSADKQDLYFLVAVGILIFIMPNTKSAEKAFRQNIRRNKKNNSRKDTYKKAIKEYRRLIISKKPEEAAAKLKEVYQALDKAARTNAIKKNKASRLKSRAASS